MFLRVLSTECLKLKRTLALWMVLVAPLVIVALQFMVAYYGAERIANNRQGAWLAIARNAIAMWTVLMMPLFVTLETSLLAGLEHAQNNWKSLLTLPAPRWMIYASKLVVMIALLWSAMLVLLAGSMLSGVVLKSAQPLLKLDALPLAPLLDPLAKIAVAALLAVTIQHWVSLRWQNFTAALGFGMCATVMGFVAANSDKFGPWFPWSMPLVMVLRGTTQPGDPNLTLAIGGAAVCATAGCWEFVRREIG